MNIPKCCQKKYNETISEIERVMAMMICTRHFVCPHCATTYCIGIYSGLSKLSVEPKYTFGDQVLIVDLSGKVIKARIRCASYVPDLYSYTVKAPGISDKQSFLEKELYTPDTVCLGLSKVIGSFAALKKTLKLELTASEISVRSLKRRIVKLDKTVVKTKARLKKAKAK